jgi:hypothetical protein
LSWKEQDRQTEDIDILFVYKMSFFFNDSSLS